MEKNIVDVIDPKMSKQIDKEMKGLTFTKTFALLLQRNGTFLPSYKDPITGGAAGKVIIHYNLSHTKEIFINTTIIFDDPALHKESLHHLVYAISDELVNRLVGYADTLLSVHSGNNSYNAEYKN